MNILALDTSSSLLSVCIQSEEKILCSLQHRSQSSSDTELVPLIDQACKKAALTIRDMSLLVCGIGPGSFTGLRVSLATVKGFVAALSIPAVGLSLLDAWALQRRDTPLYTAMVPSFSDRYFARIYRKGQALCGFIEGSVEEIRSTATSYRQEGEAWTISGLGISGEDGGIVEENPAASLVPGGLSLFHEGRLLEDRSAPIYALDARINRSGLHNKTRFSKRADK